MIASTVFVTAALLASNAEAPPPAPLSEAHAEWLERDVGAIISDVERQVFVGLPDDATRDLFIDGFWKARDPTPGTDTNERKLEHERRLAEAEKLFGRKGRPAATTARGRLWIQLGEPLDRVHYPHDGRVYPIEHWLYQGKQHLGFPAAFYAVFYQPYGAGDWRLYDPMADGPERLTSGIASGRRLRAARGRRSGEDPFGGIGAEPNPAEDPGAGGGGTPGAPPPQATPEPLPPDAFQNSEGAGRRRSLLLLREVNPVLRDVSLSLDPADPGDSRAGKSRPSSSQIVSRLREMHNHEPIDEGWIARLTGGEEVRVERKVALMALRSHVQPGFGVVHYLIEVPATNLTLTQIGERASGAVELIGDIVDAATGQTVVPLDVHLPIEVTAAELAVVRTHPLAILDALALRPGRHRLRVRVTDVASGAVGVVEESFVVPAPPADGVALGPLVLASALQEAPAGADVLRPFVLRGQQLLPAIGGRVRSGPRVSALFVAAPGGTVAGITRAQTVLEGDSGEIRKKDVDVEVIPVAGDRAVVQLEAPLRGLQAGDYRLRVAVAGVSTETAVSIVEERVARPWVMLVDRDRRPVALGLERARQLMAIGDDDDALAELDAADASTDDAVAFEVRVRRAELRLRRGDHAAAAAALAPDGGGERATSYTMLLLALARSASGDGAGAIDVLERAAERFPDDVRLLNLLGEERLRAGERAAARAAFERSLDVDPGQSEIRERIAALR